MDTVPGGALRSTPDAPGERAAQPVNAVLERLYHAGYVELPDGGRWKTEIHGMPLARGHVLYEVVRAARPAATIETGFAFGLSTLFICQALWDLGAGSHTAIDPYQETLYGDIGLAHVREAGLEPLFEFIREPSELALPDLVRQGREFELAFVDGGHRFEQAFTDFRYMDLLLPVGGFLIFDDMWLPSIAKVVRFATTNLEYVEQSIPNSPTGLRGRARRIKQVVLETRKVRDFLLGDGRHEVLGVELPRARPKQMAVLRKTGDSEREWTHFNPF